MTRLQEAHGDGKDPEQIIREKAREVVREALAIGWEGPPFDIEMLASIRGIKVRTVPPVVTKDAVLVPDPATRRFSIKVNQELPEERKRFNIGHEMTHTFFPDCASTIRYRGGPAIDDAEVEALCDAGASELLFPFESFVRDMATLGGPSFDTLVALRTLYCASWEATGNRMVSTCGQTRAMLLFSHRLKPIEERRGPCLPGMGPEARLRLDYSVRAGDWSSVFVPKHKSVCSDSVLYELLAPHVVAGSSDDTVYATEDWSELKLGRVTVAAMRLASPDSVRVLAVAAPANGGCTSRATPHGAR